MQQKAVHKVKILSDLVQKAFAVLEMKFGLIGTREPRINQFWRQNFTVPASLSWRRLDNFIVKRLRVAL
jgi:hypothetical protein